MRQPNPDPREVAGLPELQPVCYGNPMRRLLPMLRVMFLAVLLWTGSAVHAAEAVDCGVIESTCTSDVDSGGEEAPGEPDQCLCHHGGCHGHCATLASTPLEPLQHSLQGQHERGRALFDAGADLDQVSRPPIA